MNWGPFADGVNLEVESAQAQSADRREDLPTKGLVDHRRFSDRYPRPHPGGPRAQFDFVDEYNGSAFCMGSSFIAGHSIRFQRRILVSHRSMARRSGR